MVNRSSLIIKNSYHAPNKGRSIGGYVHYIGTREGVEKLSHAKTYTEYIAMRPGVEKIGTHGLFSYTDDKISLSAVEKEVEAHEGNVWTSIISLRRDDAERLGFNCAARWRDELRSQMQTMADAYKIPLDHLNWYAAYHDAKDHPHIHVIIYSDDPKEGYLTKQGIDKFKVELTKDIFSQDLISAYEQKTELRDELKVKAEYFLEEPPSATTCRQLLYLGEKLKAVEGKKTYGYLSRPLKREVDAIVEKIADIPEVKELYDMWYEQKEATMAMYTDTFPPRVPLYENKEFSSIRNKVIDAALKLDYVPPQALSSATVYIPDGKDLEGSKMALVDLSFAAMQQIIDLFENEKKNFNWNSRLDKKQYQKVMEKREAHGLHDGPVMC